MSDVLTLEAVDKDGALGEALENLGADTRKGFLKKIAIGGTTVMAGGAIAALVPSTALGQVGPAQDVRILNFALTLEFLEAEFYRQARIRNGLSGELRGFARTVGGHENAHVQFLRGALGARAVA
ncbi:MAG: ferritin-like domain-containing protein, partial [Actinobacteria bacterium]|nr:ferritin-like domain-containing protein [Actinomycetota bacterium]